MPTLRLATPKEAVVNVLTRMKNGDKWPAENGLEYFLNDAGELCYTDGEGNESVSGMRFNEFVRMVNA
jgi:hypothetical protein